MNRNRLTLFLTGLVVAASVAAVVIVLASADAGDERADQFLVEESPPPAASETISIAEVEEALEQAQLDIIRDRRQAPIDEDVTPAPIESSRFTPAGAREPDEGFSLLVFADEQAAQEAIPSVRATAKVDDNGAIQRAGNVVAAFAVLPDQGPLRGAWDALRRLAAERGFSTG